MTGRHKDANVVAIVLLVMALAIGTAIYSKAKIKQSGTDSSAVGQSGGSVSRDHERNVNTEQVAAPDSLKSDVAPHPLPFILNKKQDEVVGLMGPPDESMRMDVYEPTLIWTYHNKPYQGYTSVVNFYFSQGQSNKSSLENMKVRGANAVTYYGPFLLSKQLLPDFLLNQPPDSFYVKNEPMASPVGSRLAILWHWDNNSYVLIVFDDAKSLFVESRRVDTSTGGIKSSYQLSDRGRAWQDERAIFFIQTTGVKTFREVISGDMGTGYAKIE